MSETGDPLKDLSEIRTMMERSSRILTLSGLAGICIGIVALLGVGYAQWIHHHVPADEILSYLVADALAVLLVAIALALVFSNRMAKKKGLPLWNKTGKYLATELAIPLLAGGVFCVALLVNAVYSLLPAVMLTFYGLALVNASKVAAREVRWLGLTQVALGLIAAVFPEEGLNLWALGFGAAHIAFGILIYFRYER